MQNKNTKETKKIDLHPKKCNICGGLVIYTNNNLIYGKSYGSGKCYLCTQCGSYVGTHEPRPTEALGLLADSQMRTLKKKCHIIIDDHGIKQQKVIRTETLYELLEKTKEHKKKELFLGRVPRGYLATKQRIEDFPKIQSKTAIFLEEDVRRIIYENSVYEIPIPNLMMIHSVTTNGCVSTDLFCLEKDMDKKTAAKLLEEDRMPNLYQWPFANVSGAGGVCYGSNNIRKIERLSDLDILPILFFDSPMNSDYYTPHRTTLGKATIRELLDTLNGKKEFPYEILQEYNPLTYKRSIF